MVLDRGDRSIEIALELVAHSPRVVFETSLKEISSSHGLKMKLKQSNVKILYESEILEIKGIDDVEKTHIHNLNEDEEYELVVDSVIILHPSFPIL